MVIDGVTGWFNIPITLSAAVLLRLGRIGVGVACLGEVARQLGVALGAAVGDAGVVAVGVLVGAGHCRCQYQQFPQKPSTWRSCIEQQEA